MKQCPVLLAEKPSQAKDYASAFSVETKDKHSITLKPDTSFPNGLIITWGIGHLVELKPPESYDEKYKKWSVNNLPIFPDTFEYQVSNDKVSHFNEVKKLLKDTNDIWIGTDPDREGEAIAYLTIKHAGAENKISKRLWINSQEKEEVQRGFQNLINADKTYDYFVEAQSRQHADWLVGMNLSPLFSLLLQQQGFKGSLSIGRVQSPTVYLIYQRQQEIENFRPENFFEIEGAFQANQGSYKGKANVKEFDQEKINNIMNDHNIQRDNQGEVQSVEVKEKSKKSPKLHSLSTLQSRANKAWKYSPKKVLDIVQGLYDKKLLSYPRTDSNYITDHEFKYLVQQVEKYQSLLGVSFEPDTTAKKRYVDSSKVQEHYAIIPTRTLPELKNLKDEERNIYLEVLATTLAMFHQDYLYDETTIITDVNGLAFQSKGNTEKQKGWKALFPSKKEQQDDTEREQEQQLPAVEENELVQGKVDIKEGQTKPPKYYTEGQLVNAMKTIGKTIDDEEETEILKNNEGIGTEATRGDIIEKVKQKDYIEVKKNKVYVTNKGEILCQAIEGTLLASPSMTAKWESFLQQISKGNKSSEQFLKQIQKFIQKMIDEMPETLSNKQVITESIHEQEQKNVIAICPSCGASIEDKNKFYGCSGYRNGCKVTFPKKLAGKSLTSSMIKKLCDKGETGQLKGFKSKKGNEFKTRLVLNNDCKIEFDFGKVGGKQ